MILSQVPFIELKEKPAGLFLKEDITSYLLKSPNNAARLLKSIEDYEESLEQERKLLFN